MLLRHAVYLLPQLSNLWDLQPYHFVHFLSVEHRQKLGRSLAEAVLLLAPQTHPAVVFLGVKSLWLQGFKMCGGGGGGGALSQRQCQQQFKGWGEEHQLSISIVCLQRNNISFCIQTSARALCQFGGFKCCLCWQMDWVSAFSLM